MFLARPLKAAITTCPQRSLCKPTTLSFSQADAQTLTSPQWCWGGGGEGRLLCSSSFEVFNSSFVIYSSTGISSISVLAQPFHSRALCIFSPVVQGLCPAPGWHGLSSLNSEMLTKLNSSLSSPPLSPILSPAPPPPTQVKVPTEAELRQGSVCWTQERPSACLLKIQEMHERKKRVQREPALPRLCFFPFLPSCPLPAPPPPRAPAFNFQKHCNCLVWFQELGCHSPWWWLCWRQWHSYHA